MKHFKIQILILLFIFVVILSGCTENKNLFNSDDTPIIAVSIVPQASFVKAVAGDLADVVTSIPPGYSPANYEPTPKDVQKLSGSKIYFSIGVPAENIILSKISAINNDIKIIKLAKKISHKYAELEFSPGKRDPHIWMSPKRVVEMIKIIEEEIKKIDPQNKQTYEKNADEYILKLHKLDKKIKNSIEKSTQKNFLIYHPALGYFADDYGLEMITVEKEGKKPTIKQLQEIIDYARSKNIKTIFYQKEIYGGEAETLAEEINGVTKEIAPLSPDYIENLAKIAKYIIN
jgi:zinc transport system substrate-binding protein